MQEEVQKKIASFIAREFFISRYTIKEREEKLYIEDREFEQRLFEVAKDIIQGIRESEED